jgi:hypothetical protein
VRTVVAFLIGTNVEEIVSNQHWFGDPHSPAVVLVASAIVFSVLWIVRRPLGRWMGD